MENIINLLKSYLKLPYKNIDLDITNYIISDILKSNGNRYTDEEIEKVIKSLFFKTIYKYYTCYDVEILNAEQMDKKSKFENTIGLLGDSKAFFQRETLLDIRNLNVDILRVISHEINHGYQEYLLEHNDISYKAFLLIMERIIVTEMGTKYHEDNYDYIFEEVDAKIEAEIELYKYLNLVAPHILIKELPNIRENLVGYKQELLLMKRKFNDKYYRCEELLDMIIKEKPQYLLIYPLLNFYYLEDGTKITLDNIMLRSNSVLNSSSDALIIGKVQKLDDYVIQNRSGTKENIEKDIASIINLESDDPLICRKRDSALTRLVKCLENDYYENNIISIYDNIFEKSLNNYYH